MFEITLVYLYQVFCHEIVYSRQCAGLLIEGDGVYETLLPSGPLISLVLRNVWTLWEDPVDVSFTYFSSVL